MKLKHDSGGAGGSQGTADLENKPGIRAALKVENQCARQLGGSIEAIDSRRERMAPKVLPGQVKFAG